MQVALFGTSADPPHMGHQSILAWLARHFDRVAVWAADNPFKENQSPISDRAEMLRLLIEALPQRSGHSGCNTVALHQSLSDRYSIHSIARAQRVWPNAHLSLVVGADLIEQLPRWYQADEIFKQVDILVFPRPGYPVEGPALTALQQIATVRVAHPPNQYDISSSTYRQARCADDPAAPTATLPAVIRDYIIDHDLYPCLQQTPTANPINHPVSYSRPKISSPQ